MHSEAAQHSRQHVGQLRGRLRRLWPALIKAVHSLSGVRAGRYTSTREPFDMFWQERQRLHTCTAVREGSQGLAIRKQPAWKGRPAHHRTSGGIRLHRQAGRVCVCWGGAGTGLTGGVQRAGAAGRCSARSASPTAACGWRRAPAARQPLAASWSRSAGRRPSA